MNKELLTEAINTFGISVVNDVRLTMELTNDFDGVYATMEDMNMWEHVECLEMLYS